MSAQPARNLQLAVAHAPVQHDMHDVDATGTAVVDSTCLLCGKREILIRHGDQYYRLRHTRNGKLILTK